MLHSLRSTPKPECISAAAQRAQARASGSAGQTPACRSARYSTIASESQTTVPPSSRQGTLPVGENARNLPWLPPSLKGTSFSSNGMPSVVSRLQGRSDHDE